MILGRLKASAITANAPHEVGAKGDAGVAEKGVPACR
jgi:hypothetical protein